jgi:hypothetical protein
MVFVSDTPQCQSTANETFFGRAVVRTSSILGTCHPAHEARSMRTVALFTAFSKVDEQMGAISTPPGTPLAQ